MTHFTPFSALAGGLLIGLAAILLLWLNGRIAGISGIAGGLWAGVPGDRLWRVMFLAGLLIGAALWVAAKGGAAMPRVGFPPWLLVPAGLAVGYGTSMAGGCTSGHGICGIARFSMRSVVATGVFVSVGIVAAFIVRHLLHIG
jgi:uncharacterized membrane protein YedE/YeeE